MSRLEQRVVSRYSTLKNLSVAEIASEIQSVYGTDALKYSTVSKWRLCFQDGPDDLFDLARSGTPSRSELAAPVQPLLQQFFRDPPDRRRDPKGDSRRYLQRGNYPARVEKLAQGRVLLNNINETHCLFKQVTKLQVTNL
jgi:hypothetical protein